MVNPSQASLMEQQEGDVDGGIVEVEVDQAGMIDGSGFIGENESMEIIPTPPSVQNSDNSDSTAPTPNATAAAVAQQASTSTSGGNNSKRAKQTSSSSGSAAASARVSKACVVCSLKKRRCDGGKPQCKVCMVLGTPCSYESRGLKRGPPKGFRAGPKESAKAKMLRALETTIRDLTLHMGHHDTGREIARISHERGIHAHMITMHFEGDNSVTKKARISEAKDVEGGSGSAEVSDIGGEDDGDDVIGISEEGNLRYIGSSSGINLLQHQNSPPSGRKASGKSPMDGIRAKSSPRSGYPAIQLPTIGQTGGSSRTQDSPSSNNALSSQDVSNNGYTGMMEHHLRISRAMNQKLFHHYWTSFHPIWPILYKPALDMIHVDHLPTTLDTALVYGIYAISICVAKPPIDMEVEAELGEGPAGEIFAHLAEKFLFQNRDVPTPSFASIQTCFLLSCYHQGAGQLSKAYILSSLANTMAVDLGLHRHLHQYERDLIERESRNRLIHCIYILSTVLCSEMGRPPMLRSKDIDVPPMSESEKDEFETDSHGRQLHSASLLNTSRRLFAIIENVLTQVHSFRRKAALRRMGSEATRKFVDEIDHSLEVWKASVPQYLKFPEDVSKKNAKGTEKDVGDPIPSFVAVQIWYYTAQLLLHRPFIPQDEGISLSQLLSDKYHQKCTQNAQLLFDILLSLSKASSVDTLSTDFAYIIFTVAVMFVFNARLGHSSKFAPAPDAAHKTVQIAGISTRQSVLPYASKLSNESKRQFLMCKEWLRKLSERWPSASSHKVLLDGFTNIGEGVVTGESSGHQFTGRRPSIVNGSLISASHPEWNQQQQQIGGLNEQQQQGSNDGLMGSFGQSMNSTMDSGQNISSFVPTVMSNSSYNDSDQSLTSSSTPAFSQAQQPFDELQIASSAQNMPSTVAYSNSVAPQNSLNAYFEFPPNIFDMENVYWNETATRMTPLLGPRDANTASGMMGNANMNQSSNYRLTSYGSNQNTNTNQQNFMSSNNTNVPFTPRTLGALSAMSNYANTANHGPPQLPGGSFTVPSQQQQQQKNSGNTNVAMGPPTSVRSGQGSTNKEPLSNSPGLQMLAQAITSVPKSENDGKDNNTSSQQQQQPPPQAAMVNQPSFSPFSFHQEPSAPEWGDVISMLQLPPAFIQ